MTATSGRRKSMATVTTEMGQLQPLSPEKTAAVGGVMGKTWRIFVDAVSVIQEGDEIRDENSKLYRVVTGGITQRTQGVMDYKEITIEETT